LPKKITCDGKRSLDLNQRPPTLQGTKVNTVRITQSMQLTVCEKRIPQSLSSHGQNIVFKVNNTTNSQWNPSEPKHPAVQP